MTHALSPTLPLIESSGSPPSSEPRSVPAIVHAALVGFGATDPGIVSDLVGANEWCEVVPLAVDSFDDPAVLKQIDVAILIDDPHPTYVAANGQGTHFDKLLTHLRRHRIGAAVITNRPWAFSGFVIGVVCVPPKASRDVLRGVCLALSHLRPVLRQLDLELTTMEYLGDQLERHFDDINHELRLASRLQRDFLPRELPNEGPLRFHTLFRPCGWVSGDTFDVFRLDTHHIGFYVADAVGHGVAAGLLTMMIKNAIQMSRSDGEPAWATQLMQPGNVLRRLNESLAAQQLPDSQFITAWYGVIDTASMRLRYASGGHPPPILFDAEGRPTDINGDGCLVGIFPNQEFAEREVQLCPGHRLLVFSDGLESVLFEPIQKDGESRDVAAPIRAAAQHAPEKFVAAVTRHLEASKIDPAKLDDITLILADVLPIRSR